MTQQIKQINILDMMKMYGEDSCNTVLSTFMCPLNLDVEDFIQNKATELRIPNNPHRWNEDTSNAPCSCSEWLHHNYSPR